MHDFVIDVNRRAELLDGMFKGLHRSGNTSTKTAWLC
jgi:hypothetical protein